MLEPGTATLNTGQYTPTTSVFYDHGSGGLFIATGDGGLLGGNSGVSWDEGANWSPLMIDHSGQKNGFAFWNDDSGMKAGNYIGGAAVYSARTTDAGRTWNEIPFDSTIFQPASIPGTTVGVAITPYGTVMRTEDMWATWKTVYQFPRQPFPSYVYPDSEWGSACIEGRADGLYTMMSSGCYRSTDLGSTWKYTCSPRSAVSTVRRSYVSGKRIYVPMNDFDNMSEYTLWMLDLDSLYGFQSSFLQRYSDGTMAKSVLPGDQVSVTYKSIHAIDTSISVDTLAFCIRADSNAVEPASFSVSPGWSIVQISAGGSNIKITIADTARRRLNVSTSPLTVTFNTFLSQPSCKIYLDSVQGAGHRINCDCLVQSTAGPDSVELDFQFDCADSVIYGFMKTGRIPLAIESIHPNPARGEILVRLTGLGSGAETAPSTGVYDVLGLNHPLTPSLKRRGDSAYSFDVSALEAGTYFLRVEAGGQVATKRFVVER